MNENKTFDLFANIDATSNDFLDSKEVDMFGDLFNLPASSNDLFGNSEPVAVQAKPETAQAEPETKEIPVVPAPKVSTQKKATSKTKKKNPALTKNIKEQIKKNDERKVDGTWQVAYAARRLNPPHEMTIEELRQFLELDWPELSKDRCSMTIDEEKKLIVPIVNGAKNG